jgi:hypothetical protein
MPSVVRILLGAVFGAAVAGLMAFGLLSLLGVSPDTGMPIAAVAGAIGGTYTAIALGFKVYALRFFSIVGLFLDLTWSLVNTLGGLLVWIPACLIGGARFIAPGADSRRSGTFVYSSNPRGGGYAATTIGTVIAGGWSSHEEIHVWQARIFGPFYFVAYVVNLVLNMLMRLITGRTKDLGREAYYRICFEEWAYWSGSDSGGAIRWGPWLGGFFLSLLYVVPLVLVVVGLVAGEPAMWIVSLAVLVLYSLVRALLPRGH